MTTERLFKILDDNSRSYHSNIRHWHLPHGGQPGDWMPPIEGELASAKNGYHLFRKQDLLHWLGPFIYEAETHGERLNDDTYIIVREARLLVPLFIWNKRIARLFACDCAEYALPLYERAFPGDARLRKAIKVARLYANKRTSEELLAASNVVTAAIAKDTENEVAESVAFATRKDILNTVNAASLCAIEAAVAGAIRGAGIWASANSSWDVVRLLVRERQSQRLMLYLFGDAEPFYPPIS